MTFKVLVGRRLFSKLVFGSIFVISCNNLGSPDKPAFTLADAQSWFTEYSSTDSNADNLANAKSDLKKRVPKWEYARMYNNRNESYVLVPVWFENKFRFGKRAIRQLRISKNKEGFQHQFIEYLATESHVAEYNGINQAKFSGTLSIHDWKTGLKTGYQIENGNMIGYVVSYEDSKLKKRSTAQGRTENCGYYEYTYVSIPAYGLYYTRVKYVSLTCPVYTYTVPFDYYSWFASQYGCEVFNNCIDPYTYQEPEPVPVPTITNNTTDPCINLQVNTALGLNMVSEIGQMVNKFFGINDDVNLQLFQTDKLPADTDGLREVARHDNNSDWLDVDIFFNENTLPNSSHEYVLATVYHEFLHAILDFHQIYGPMQHETMADFYIKTMKEAVKSTYSTISDTDAELLAWGGLQETEAWEKLSENFKSKVLTTNAAYKSGAKGKKCKP